MKISMKGYGENTVTLKTEGLVCVNHAVKMADDFTVAPCSEGDNFVGAVVNVRNDYACVQLAGYARFSCTGEGFAAGYCKLAADGKGGVMISENGREYLVTDVDTATKTAGIIL